MAFLDETGLSRLWQQIVAKLGNYMTKDNPSGTGALSLNRKASTSVGQYSVAEGKDNTATGYAAHAEGTGTTSSADSTHAEGYQTTASAWYAHAEGNTTTASNRAAHAEGGYTTASGQQSHAEGFQTIAASTSQHVQGKYNIEDAADTYAHIVGNGSSDGRSNAHTLDWDGNAWYAGGISSKGMLELAPYDNGSSRLFKNHSATADYGTVLQDVDKNGNTIKLTLMANDGSLNFVDKSANIHKVLTASNTKDYVIEEGTSGIWYYRKWNSGLAEAWGIVTSDTGTFSLWDSGSYLKCGANPVAKQSYPFAFTSGVRLTYDIYSFGNVSVFGIAGAGGYNTQQETPEVWVVSGSSASDWASVEVTAEYHVVGRWK